MISALPSPSRQPLTGWHLLNTLAATTAAGVGLSPLLYELTVATGLLTAIPETSSSCGDTPAQWLALRVGLLWGAATGVLLAVGQLRQRRRWAVPDVLLDLLALYLSLILFRYGFVKVLATQFPRLWANLDTPPAELTPMRVAWQFFGYSRGYQQFLGWGEVLPAVLLLFRRTRTLGAFIATVVMLNVFVVNIFFDVCVKIGSGSYLFFALLLLLQDADRLWQFFVGHRPAALRTLAATANRFGRRGRRTYQAISILLTLTVVGLTVMDVQGIQEYATEQAAVLPLTGVWETTRAARWANGHWQPLIPADSAYPTRVLPGRTSRAAQCHAPRPVYYQARLNPPERNYPTNCPQRKQRVRCPAPLAVPPHGPRLAGAVGPLASRLCSAGATPEPPTDALVFRCI